jgi:hypothetical protein
MLKNTIPVISIAVMMFIAGCEMPGQTESLFNGRDLSGWDGKMKFWRVQDGAITGEVTEENPISLEETHFLIWRGGTVEDFELRFKYRVTKGNSGMQFRSWEMDNFGVGGYQADFEAGEEYTGALWEGDGRGTLVSRGGAVVIKEDGRKGMMLLGETDELIKHVDLTGWNDYLIRAVGDTIELEINGVRMTRLVDREKGKASSKGIIAIQLHGGIGPQFVQVKDIKLKRL